VNGYRPRRSEARRAARVGGSAGTQVNDMDVPIGPTPRKVYSTETGAEGQREEQHMAIMEPDKVQQEMGSARLRLGVETIRDENMRLL